MNEEIFLAIRKVVNEHDPAGVIFDSETEDEYNPEVKEILELLKNNQPKENLAKEIHDIFVRYFNSEIAGDQSKYEPIALEISELPELRLNSEKVG